MNSSQMICAIGAATISIPFVVNAGTLLVDHSGATGSYTTISAAIADAATGDTIEIKPGVYTETLHVARDLTLECSDPSRRVVVNAGGVDRALNNNSSSSYANIDFTNGYSWWAGGGCMTSGSPIFTNCRFYDNDADWAGGGVHIAESPQFLNCEFYENKSTSYGGGCAVGGFATPQFNDCSFHDNESEEGGGVSVSFSTQADFFNCTFINNEAIKSGGAAANIGHDASASSKFTDCLFEDNSAGDAGGALYACYGDMEVIGSDLRGNTAQYGGGLAVYRDANATVVATSIRENNARHGGGVCLNVDAAFSGGLSEFSTLILQDNTATFGGSVFASRAKAHMKNCLLADAYASNQGGHVYADASRFDVQLCSFESGHAVNRGGMLLLVGDSTYVGEDNSYLDGQSLCGAMIWAKGADMGSVRGTFNDITSEIDAQQGSRIERGRAVYTDDCTIKFDKAIFSGFKLNDYFGISLFEHRDSYMVYEECVLENCSMKSPMRFPGSTAPRTTILNADGSHVEMTNCTVENNKTGKHGNIIESTAGTMTVENSEFKKNGQISMGRISRGSIRKLSMNGVLRCSGGTLEIKNNFFCGNHIANWSGSLTNVGGNALHASCP